MTSDTINIYSSNSVLADLRTVSGPSVQSLIEVRGRASSLAFSKAAQKCSEKNIFITPSIRAGNSQPLKLSGLDLNKLKLLLSQGEYPDKYRFFIWRCLLQLPNNYEAFLNLSKKGIFSNYVKLQDMYPIKSLNIFRRLQRLLSSLAHWAPIFGEVHYLPSFVFHFVIFLQNNEMICFEIVATVLSNWCKYWFENFPDPPFKILAAVETILSHSDPNLANHYIQHDIASQVYAWPLLNTGFSEVLAQKEWLILWDHVLSNIPSYILLIVVAFNSVNRSAILSCSCREDFEQFFHRHNSSDIKLIIKKANHLQSIIPNDFYPNKCMEPFIPLTNGKYPVFSQYPLYIESEKRGQKDILDKDIQNCLVSSKNIKQLDSYTETKPCGDEALRMLKENISKLMDKQTSLHTLMQNIRLAELNLVKTTTNKFKHSNSERLLTQLKEEIDLKSIMFNQKFEETFLKSKETNQELQSLKQQLQRHMDFFRTEDQFDQQDSSIHCSQKHQFEHKFLQVVCLNSQSIILLQEIRSHLEQMDEQKIGFNQRKSVFVYNENVEDASTSSPAKKSLHILESMLDDPMECLPSAFLTDVRDLRRKILNEVLSDCRSSRLQSMLPKNVSSQS